MNFRQSMTSATEKPKLFMVFQYLVANFSTVSRASLMGILGYKFLASNEMKMSSLLLIDKSSKSLINDSLLLRWAGTFFTS